jgi:hypothetical protein
MGTTTKSGGHGRALRHFGDKARQRGWEDINEKRRDRGVWLGDQRLDGIPLGCVSSGHEGSLQLVVVYELVVCVGR